MRSNKMTKFEFYGNAHRKAKKLLGKENSSSAYRMISVKTKNVNTNGELNLMGEPTGEFFNEKSPVPESIKLMDVYPVENIVQRGAFPSFDDSFQLKKRPDERMLGIGPENAVDTWLEFVKSSVIPQPYRYSGLHYAGYILDAEEWCLPSWIWTNASLVKMFCQINKVVEAKKLTDKIIELQQDCGGWIVRNDYDQDGAIPILAPNDSAYVANNACLELYLACGDEKYLNSAVKCADWIYKTSRKDGMVYAGFDTKRKHWQSKHNIVDIGFTAALFARLYKITKKQEYLEFLKKFVNKYIDLFYIPRKHGFATALDENDKQLGGMFGRGQAWALEGLIPASEVLNNDKRLDTIIDSTVRNLVHLQDKTGGWAYNLTRKYMGIDCKATPIIAVSLLNWYEKHPVEKAVRRSAEKAYDWCLKHTNPNGESKGGIFSYTVEGSIVHHMYTWTAFVYGSSYAIELNSMLLGVK